MTPSPRGFAFAAVRLQDVVLGLYIVHLKQADKKTNAVRHLKPRSHIPKIGNNPIRKSHGGAENRTPQNSEEKQHRREESRHPLKSRSRSHFQ